MSRFSILAGSVLFAISRVNAGPCRPSSSVISSGLETATTSTEVVEPTATLASTLTTETEASETLSIIVSTTEVSMASEDTATESATTTEGVTTTEATNTTTTGAATTTEVSTTTAETTTALATTSTAPVLEPRRDCGSFSTPYTAPNEVVYNIRCSTDFYPTTFDPAQFYENVASFEECLSKCETSSGCNGVQWDNLNSYCATIRSFGGTLHSPGNDIAFRVGG